MTEDPRDKRPRRMRREDERIARLNQLAEMGKLAAGLAHELKNPLSTLKLNLQLLEEDLAEAFANGGGAIQSGSSGGASAANGGGERARNRIHTLKKEADRLRQTLDDFLRYAGRIELRLATVPLNSLVEDLVDFLLPQAQAHKVRILTSLSPDNPLCQLDSNLFKQALLNLMLNAIQAMPNGGELLIRTLASKSTATLHVSDTGVGIPPENLPRIFDAYFTTKKGGTGLGLPTTRRIIEEHDGLIAVTSDPAQGTNFRIDLPLAPQPPHPNLTPDP